VNISSFPDFSGNLIADVFYQEIQNPVLALPPKKEEK
jgi:hypothetical protein